MISVIVTTAGASVYAAVGASVCTIGDTFECKVEDASVFAVIGVSVCTTVDVSVCKMLVGTSCSLSLVMDDEGEISTELMMLFIDEV